MKKKLILLSVLVAALSSAVMINTNNWKKQTNKQNKQPTTTGKRKSQAINFSIILGLLLVMNRCTPALELWLLIPCNNTFSFL